MCSEGFFFFLDLGVEACSLAVAVVSATVRNLSQPFAAIHGKGRVAVLLATALQRVFLKNGSKDTQLYVAGVTCRDIFMCAIMR